MIFFTGDIHSDITRFRPYIFPEQSALTKDDYMIICGDFGLVWDYYGMSTKEYLRINELEDKSYTTLFVDGNHENYDRLNELPVEEWHGGLVQKLSPSVIHLMRGQVYEIDGKKFFTFGGAASHDISDGILERNDFKTEEEFIDTYNKMEREGKSFRVNHFSWWKEEMPNEKEYEIAKDNLKKNDYKVDYIISHDISGRILHQMYDNIGGCNPNQLNDFFDWVDENVEYKHWYFGHHHIDRDFDNNKISCVYSSIIPDRPYAYYRDHIEELSKEQTEELFEKE